MTHGTAPVHAPGVGDHWLLLLRCKGSGCLRASSKAVEAAGLKCLMRCDEGVDAREPQTRATRNAFVALKRSPDLP